MKKIVMKVPTNDDPKRQSMAMKTASKITGITTVALEGSDKDRLVVVGDGVDVVKLTALLRKKIGHAELLSVGPARENIEKKDKEGGGEKKDKGGGGKGGGGSEKKDKEGGGRAGEKNDKANGELRRMGANKVYCGMFTYGPGTCAEAVVHEQKQEELAVDCSPFNEGWLLTVAH